MVLIVCPHCGRKLSDERGRCPDCGKRILRVGHEKLSWWWPATRWGLVTLVLLLVATYFALPHAIFEWRAFLVRTTTAAADRADADLADAADRADAAFRTADLAAVAARKGAWAASYRAKNPDAYNAALAAADDNDRAALPWWLGWYYWQMEAFLAVGVISGRAIWLRATGRK